MMHYKLSGCSALCIYVYTCIGGYHVEKQACARVCVCLYVCVNKRLNYMNIFVCLFDLSGVVSDERKGNGTDGTCFCFPP